MKDLVEKRELSIEDKIFTKDDVISLVRLFVKLSNEILDKSKEIKRRELIGEGWAEQNITHKHIDTSHSGIEFTSSDSSKYTLKFADLIEVNKILDNKNIIEIELKFNEPVLRSKFLIRIRQSSTNSGSSYAIVEGEESIWVNDAIKVVEAFISSCKNQSVFIKKFRLFIIGSTIVLLTLFLLNLVELFIKTMVMFPKIVDSLFTKDIIFYIVLLALVAAAPAVFIYTWLAKLFPGIEIQTGEDFKKAENEKRSKFWLIISLIIILTIISYLFRLL